MPQNHLKMLAGIRQGTQELCQDVDYFNMMSMLLQGRKKPGILDGRCRVSGKGETEQHVIHYPMVAGAFRGQDETNRSTSCYEREQQQRTNTQLLHESGRQEN